MNILELENKLNSCNISLTNREICRIIGMAEESYSRKKKMGSDIKQRDLAKIENKFNITLINRDIINSTVNILPACASCGNGITIDTSLIYNYDEKAQYIFAIASGNSMSPVLENQDIVLAKKYDGNFTDGIYLFNIGDDFFIKTLAKNVNQIECISANPQYDKIVLKGQELDKLVILGSVCGIIRRL